MQVKFLLKYFIANAIDDESIEKARLKVIVDRFKAFIARVSEQLVRAKLARKLKDRQVKKRQIQEAQADFKRKAKLEKATQ